VSRREPSTDTICCTWNGEALKENAVGWLVRRLRGRLEASGVKTPIHPHAFRHNFLTDKALGGGDPSMVRR
jgi:integrase